MVGEARVMVGGTPVMVGYVPISAGPASSNADPVQRLARGMTCGRGSRCMSTTPRPE